MNTNTTMTVKNIGDIADFTVPAMAPRNLKENIIENYINPSKFEFLGFVDRSNDAIFRERFYNVRDNKGRWARIKGVRR
jgi:hypothetical protein